MDRERSCSLGTVLCVLTGASRGLGRSLAWELCPRVAPGSALLLVARTEQALRVLSQELTLQYADIEVRWVAADLGTADGVKKTVQAAQELNGRDAAQRVLIINNAGSLGDVSRSFVEFMDPLEVDRYFSLNVSSALCLTSSPADGFPETAWATAAGGQHLIPGSPATVQVLDAVLCREGISGYDVQGVGRGGDRHPRTQLRTRLYMVHKKILLC
ncbi:unnamed protein product [Staurois parvus]|uniref:Sepiapterin reductase n=1 Tax=Staurois parvus TaxID=386267 RepID=A0ABN9GTG2_9NEOB|nr:unnamed protein product [Staurois parvus]